MTKGVQTFCGERLREARLARGMFKKTLGDLVGISGTAIARYEDGDDKPQRERLDSLAAHLGFAPEYFLRSGWREDLEPVFWRSRAAESKQAREMTEQRMRWVCEAFSFLEREVNFPELTLPKLDLPGDFMMITAETVELAAEQVREYWNLRERPIPDVTLALENAGVPVINLEITSDKQDGFCFWSKQLERPFVGINTNCISACRARYDVAHELGHLVLHRHVTLQEERSTARKKIMEDQAHRFAGAFLFPRGSFRREVGYPSLDYFCDLKKRWGISIAAMVYRAYSLGMISEGEKTMLFQSMSKRRWRGILREPFDSPDEVPLERPRMLRRGFEIVAEESVFGLAAIRSELPFPAREIEQIVGLDAGALSDTNIIELSSVSRKQQFQLTDLENGRVLEFPLRQRR